MISADPCVYGPVPSRRLGRSLGVDLVPRKTCTFDCIYCQLGPTTHKTVRRNRWLDSAAVVARVRERLSTKPDFITLAGSGEPSLYAGLGEVIEGIKGMTGTPVAVITNGSLLGLPEVREGLADADVVVPSLDAPDQGLFARVNRPHASLDLATVMRGMAAFRETFGGEIWLEVMLLAGITGSPDVVARLASVAAQIAPDRIQLTTAVRPPSDPYARALTPDQMEPLAALFTPRAEVIGHATLVADDLHASPEDVLALVARRPCSLEDIAAGLGIHIAEALKLVAALTDAGDIHAGIHEGRRFYVARGARGSSGLRKESP